MEDNITTDVRAKESVHPSSLFPCRYTQTGTFDVAPLVEALTEDGTPSEMAQALNECYNFMVDVVLTDDTYNTQYYSGLIYNLRVVRDAILKGAGIIDFQH